jgi:Flp pilus assembly protein TadG
MQRLAIKLSNRSGFTLILSMLLLTVFIGAAVFAVDVGHMNLRRADVHAASDAAALAGAMEFATLHRADSALTEAQAFAGKFKADTSHLSVAAADFTTGHWSGTAFTPSPLPTGTDTNAARAIVRYTGAYTFGPVLGISSHQSSATSIAVAINGKSITRSSCVSPIALSYQALLDAIYPPAGTKDTTYKLTASDVTLLNAQGASNAVSLDIPNKDDLLTSVFIQTNLPPVQYANGTAGSPGSNGSPPFMAGYTCTGSADTVGVGDWLQFLPGQKAGKTQVELDSLAGTVGGYPVKVEVAIVDALAQITPSSLLCPCYHVKYLGAFTITGSSKKAVTGYFTGLGVRAAGAVTTGGSGSVGPVTLVKTRLVF